MSNTGDVRGVLNDVRPAPFNKHLNGKLDGEIKTAEKKQKPSERLRDLQSQSEATKKENQSTSKWVMSEFTPAQQQAIELQIIACAGSGKTQVLVERILRLLREGAPPQYRGVHLHREGRW